MTEQIPIKLNKTRNQPILDFLMRRENHMSMTNSELVEKIIFCFYQFQTVKNSKGKTAIETICEEWAEPPVSIQRAIIEFQKQYKEFKKGKPAPPLPPLE
ncbi:MAG: hypothetical protein ABIC95_02015 [archaeon]